MYFQVEMSKCNQALENANIFQNSSTVNSFFPENLNFSDVLGIISVLIGLISIALTILIYKLSNATSEKMAEDAARRAFEKQKELEKNFSEKSEDSVKVTNLNRKQCKALKKHINKIIHKAKINSTKTPWIYAASFPIQLKKELSEEETVYLMYKWKRKSFITWVGDLENTTKIYILKGESIVENIDSCQLGL